MTPRGHSGRYLKRKMLQMFAKKENTIFNWSGMLTHQCLGLLSVSLCINTLVYINQKELIVNCSFKCLLLNIYVLLFFIVIFTLVTNVFA